MIFRVSVLLIGFGPVNVGNAVLLGYERGHSRD